MYVTDYSLSEIIIKKLEVKYEIDSMTGYLLESSMIPSYKLR